MTVAEDEGPVEELDEQQCWELMGGATLGRLALCVAGEVDIYPVNYYADGTSILFRTAPGTKLLELTVHDAVAFETDGYTEREAWSVVAHGRAGELESQSDIRTADEAPLRPWIPTLKYRYVRIIPERMTGRRFPLAPEPERY
jgi:uncharacterized protein